MLRLIFIHKFFLECVYFFVSIYYFFPMFLFCRGGNCTLTMSAMKTFSVYIFNADKKQLLFYLQIMPTFYVTTRIKCTTSFFLVFVCHGMIKFQSVKIGFIHKNATTLDARHSKYRKNHIKGFRDLNL